jgi:hypothetical protein
MRKSLIFSLMAASLFIFCSPAFAGQVEVCEPLKVKDDDYVPGLYGLCIAWHNADDEAREIIAANYRKKSGGLEVPGSNSFSCLCWNDVSFDDACVIANDADLVVPGSNAVTFLDADFMIATNFGADFQACALQVVDLGNGNVFVLNRNESVSGPEAETCMAELAVIATLKDSSACAVE